jgi:hypothetical protein
MPLYRIGDQILSSSQPLPGLAELHQGAPRYTFILRPARVQAPGQHQWFHRWTSSDDEIWTAFARHGSGYLLRFPELADFQLAADATQIDCFPAPGTPLNTIAHLLLDQVFPVVLSKSGRLVMHASAVATPDGAIAFVGSSGRGKSTLAASFALQGFPLMTDDCLLIDESNCGLTATPSYPGARLWDDSIETLFKREPVASDVAHYTDKKRLTLENGQLHFHAERAHLRGMFFLADPAEARDDQEIKITELTPRETFMELVSFSFKLDIDDREMLAHEFQRLQRLAMLPLFYRISYPHDFARLPAVRAAILEAVERAVAPA